MCVIDLYQLYLNHDKQKYQTMTIIKFSDLICQNLKKRERKPTILRHDNANGTIWLSQITDDDGNFTREPINTQKMKHGWNVRSAFSNPCFICHRYLYTSGNPVYNSTTFCAPLQCRSFWRHQEKTCYMEHKCSKDVDISCVTGTNKSKRKFPLEKQVHLNMGKSFSESENESENDSIEMHPM